MAHVRTGRQIMVLGGVMWALLTAPSLAHDCIKPAAPLLPDKSTLEASARNAVTAQIEAYIGATNVYLACLEQSDADARAEAQRIVQGWEAPVTDIQAVTD